MAGIFYFMTMTTHSVLTTINPRGSRSHLREPLLMQPKMGNDVNDGKVDTAIE